MVHPNFYSFQVKVFWSFLRKRETEAKKKNSVINSMTKVFVEQPWLHRVCHNCIWDYR